MQTNRQRIHLKYLDGLRGMAALYVVIHHIWQFVVTRPDLGATPNWFRIMTIFKFGSYGVAVFIVLSGYCLMLPVARSEGFILKDGTAGFIKRRVKRILPPYYAALCFSLLITTVIPRLQEQTGTQWDIALPVFSSGGIISHLFLLHNLFESWQWNINPPMWSVALEWQIYFVFALILLPVLRYANMFVCSLVAFILGFLPLLFGAVFMSSWMIWLFGLGMIAAVINFTPRFTHKKYLLHTPWMSLSAALWCMSLVFIFVPSVRTMIHTALQETTVGLAAATLIIGVTQRIQHSQPIPWPLRLLDRPFAVQLGHFSYSLYLIHFPLLTLLFLFLLPFHMMPTSLFIALVTFGLPILLLLAFLFHLAFERPFMQVPQARFVPVQETF